MKWTQQNKRSLPSPPGYLRDVVEGDQLSVSEDGPPPSYISLSLPPYVGQNGMFIAPSEVAREQSNIQLSSARKNMHDFLQAFFAIMVRKNPDRGSNPTNDPTLEISCDGNVMRSNLPSNYLTDQSPSSSSK